MKNEVILEDNKLYLKDKDSQKAQINTEDFLSFFKYQKKDPNYKWENNNPINIWCRIKGLNLYREAQKNITSLRTHLKLDNKTPFFIYWMWFAVVACSILLLIVYSTGWKLDVKLP